MKKLISTRKLAGTYREVMKIESGTTGHGYANVFGRFLDGTVTYIDIEDPYIRAFHQVRSHYRSGGVVDLFEVLLLIEQCYP